MAKSRVKKRPDGRYVMQIYIGMVDGKRKYKSVYGSTPKEVERKAQEVRIMLGKGMDVAAMRDTVEEWASRWINMKKLTVSKKHAITCEQKSKVISQYLGKTHITDLRTSECRGFQPLRASHLKSLKIPVFMGFPGFFIFYGILQNQSKIRVF